VNGQRLALAGRRLDSAEASELTLERSAVRVARGTTVHLDRSASALTVGKDVHLRRSAGALSIGGKVVVEQGGSQWLVGGVVQARRIIAVAVIAGKVEGQVRCLFDAKGAFAFGAGLALMGTLLRLLVGRR
jgi:large exoprotein involved in heme utilization and adhesion